MSNDGPVLQYPEGDEYTKKLPTSLLSGFMKGFIGGKLNIFDGHDEPEIAPSTLQADEQALNILKIKFPGIAIEREAKLSQPLRYFKSIPDWNPRTYLKMAYRRILDIFGGERRKLLQHDQLITQACEGNLEEAIKFILSHKDTFKYPNQYIADLITCSYACGFVNEANQQLSSFTNENAGRPPILKLQALAAAACFGSVDTINKLLSDSDFSSNEYHTTSSYSTWPKIQDFYDNAVFNGNLDVIKALDAIRYAIFSPNSFKQNLPRFLKYAEDRGHDHITDYLAPNRAKMHM